MVLPIYLYGQAVLREETDEIEEGEMDVKSFVRDLFDTLKVADGCGLAAPQVGKSIRVFVVDGSALGEDYPDCVNFKQEFINPIIVDQSKETSVYSEGCLSLPGISENVIRPKTITINYLDSDFVEHEETYTDFKARIVLHEYDHLEGHVFTDRISPLKKAIVRGKLEAIAKGKTTGRYKCHRN